MTKKIYCYMKIHQIDIQKVSKETGIDVRVAEDAASCVALGTGKVLESLDILADSLTYSGKKYTS